MTDFQKQIEGIEFRHAVKKDGGYLFLEVPNAPGPLRINFSDAETVASLRIYWVKEIGASVIQEEYGRPVRVSLANVLLGRARFEVIGYRDSDPLNLTRPNLMPPKIRGNIEPSPIALRGDTAYVTLSDGSTALCDRDEYQRIRSHFFTVVTDADGSIELRTKFYSEYGDKRVTSLPRLILGLNGHSRAKVIHINGDRRDCRKANLEVIQSRKQRANP